NAFNAKVAPWIHELQPGGPVRPDLMKLKEISLADFIRQEKVAPKVAEWIRISLECEIATAWDRISALDGIAEYHIFLGDGEECYRVTGGNDKFTQAMAKSVGTGNISLNHRATKIVSHGKEQVEVSYLHTESNQNG